MKYKIDYTKNNKFKINLVIFYSEGEPNDEGLDLKHCKELVIQNAKDYVDNITFYTPKKLIDMGYHKYVKNNEDKGLMTMNLGLNNIGFSAWKPLIIKLELDKANEDDIVIYRDCNIIKYPTLGNYKNIRETVNKCFKVNDFDFFFPRQNEDLKLKEYTKTNVIRELGNNHIFTYNFPLLFSGLLTCFKKSNISYQFLKEWEDACLNNKWINGNKYGELDPGFKWSTAEQGIMGVITANWIRNRKHNIPLKFPEIIFLDRDIDKITYAKNYSYLQLL